MLVHKLNLTIRSNYIFFLRNTVQTQTLTSACTLIPINTRMQPYPYEHLQETESADPRDWRSYHWRLTIDGKCQLNPGINSEKCEHQCRVEDSNPGGQVPPQGTLPAELYSVRRSNINDLDQRWNPCHLLWASLGPTGFGPMERWTGGVWDSPLTWVIDIGPKGCDHVCVHAHTHTHYVYNAPGHGWSHKCIGPRAKPVQNFKCT